MAELSTVPLKTASPLLLIETVGFPCASQSIN